MRHRRLHSSTTCQHWARTPVRRRSLCRSSMWWHAGAETVSLLWKLATPGPCYAFPTMCGYLLVCFHDNGDSVYSRLGIHALAIPLVLWLLLWVNPPWAAAVVMGACIYDHCVPCHAPAPPIICAYSTHPKEVIFCKFYPSKKVMVLFFVTLRFAIESNNRLNVEDIKG